MKKIAAFLSLCFLFAGCSSTNQKVNPEQLAEAILSQGNFETQFIKLDEDQLEAIYPDAQQCSSDSIVYESDSTELELIAVFQVTDKAAATNMLKQRQQYLLHEAQNYFPEQTQRIEQALIMEKDDCMILVICDDVAAIEQIIKDFK